MNLPGTFDLIKGQIEPVEEGVMKKLRDMDLLNMLPASMKAST